MRGSWAVAVVAGWSGAAAAQDLAFDIAPTSTCVEQADWSAGPPYDCVGAAADACMETPDGSSTVGMGYCLDAEWQWWDARLNQVYAGVMKQDKATDAEMAGTDATVPPPGREPEGDAARLDSVPRRRLRIRDGAVGRGYRAGPGAGRLPDGRDGTANAATGGAAGGVTDGRSRANLPRYHEHLGGQRSLRDFETCL